MMRTVLQQGDRKVKMPKYYIVESRSLPEIFLKVAEAKRMMEMGEAATVNNAVQKVGISRSAFYKYKDAIRPFNDMLHGRIVTVQLTMRNEPGILSSALSVLGKCGGNILTINQNIPSGGCAVVSIGVETTGLALPLDEVIVRVSALRGILKCELLAG